MIYSLLTERWTDWLQHKNIALLCLAVVRLSRSWCGPSDVSPGYIHWPASHVTGLMLKNALVNINRPGWQDTFAFMPEEEKTSISLTQKLPHYCIGGHPLKVQESVLIVLISFSLRQMASRRQPGANTSIQPTGWLAATCGSLLRPWVVCEILQPVESCPSQPAVWPMEKDAIGMLIVKASYQYILGFYAIYKLCILQNDWWINDAFRVISRLTGSYWFNFIIKYLSELILRLGILEKLANKHLYRKVRLIRPLMSLSSSDMYLST